MKTVIAVSTAAMVLGGLLAAAGVSAQYVDVPCGHLFLDLPPRYIISEVTCLKGKVVYQGERRANFVQNDLDGPECKVKIAHQLLRSEFTVKQKFCFLKAGDITFTHNSGARPYYFIEKGKFWKEAGSVTVTSLEHSK